MKKLSLYFLSTLLFLSFTINNAQSGSDTETDANSIEAFLDDPELVDAFLNDQELKESEAGTYFINAPEWFVSIQEWVDTEVSSRYPDQRDMILEKLVLLDGYMREHSNQRLNLIKLIPWLVAGSSVTMGAVVLYSILHCCRTK